MAIVRIPRKLKKFEYEGVTFALRPAKTKEQLQVSKYLSEFQRTIKADIKEDTVAGIVDKVAQNGNNELVFEAQKYVAKNLVVDPETQQQVFGDGEGQENVEDVPFEFLREAWFCYTDQTTKRYFAVKLVDVFGEEFVRKNAIIESPVVDAEIVRLELEDTKKAHQAKIALDLVKPGESSSENPPQATTTSVFAEASSPSPNSFISLQEKSESGSSPNS